ncbi:hypothetical protein LINGRAHAP2_LOCUS23198, partial [Linum grandiflorum]
MSSVAESPPLSMSSADVERHQTSSCSTLTSTSFLPSHPSPSPSTNSKRWSCFSSFLQALAAAASLQDCCCLTLGKGNHPFTLRFFGRNPNLSPSIW